MGFLLAALFILAEPVWPEGRESETNLTVTFTAEFTANPYKTVNGVEVL